jgi:hypothetical protein
MLPLVSLWYKCLLIFCLIVCILNNIVKFRAFFLYIKNSKCYLIYLIIEIPVCFDGGWLMEEVCWGGGMDRMCSQKVANAQ